MNIPPTEQFPDDPERLPPARRRRARRLLAPLDDDERTLLLDRLAHRASPTFDFFLFSLVSGAILALGFLLNNIPLLVLGAVSAPFLAPVVGAALGTITGSVRFFLRSLMGLLVGCSLVLALGAAAGLAAPRWAAQGFSLSHLNAQLSWPDLLVLALGAILTAAASVHEDRRPEAPSVALAYELFLPLSTAGFGLTSGEAHLFPDGLVVFAVHLSLAVVLGALTLAALGFRPLTLFGYTLGAAVTLLFVILLVGLGSAGAAFSTQIGVPTAIPTATLSPTPTPTQTNTPVPPTVTLTPTLTLTPTVTATITPSPSPTPIQALVAAATGGGAFLRDAPEGKIVGLLTNGTLMKVFPEKTDLNGVTWVRVETPDGTQGWILQTLLVTATPSPDW